MKKISFLLLSGLITLCFTSCLDDNDYTGPSNEDYITAAKKMQGTYQGSLEIVADTTILETRPNQVWKLDSTFVTKDVPVCEIAKQLQNNPTDSAEIAKLEPQHIYASLSFVTIQSAGYVYYIAPQTKTIKVTKQENKEDVYNIQFNTSVGNYVLLTGTMKYYLEVAKITKNGYTINGLKTIPRFQYTSSIHY